MRGTLPYLFLFEPTTFGSQREPSRCCPLIIRLPDAFPKDINWKTSQARGTVHIVVKLWANGTGVGLHGAMRGDD